MPKRTSARETIDLAKIAHQAMIDEGFAPDAGSSVAREVQSIVSRPKSVSAGPSIRNLKSLLWSSIDDAKTRDIDQVEYAESLSGGDIRLLIAIADVDVFVPRDSAIDRHARHNSTSVYTGVKTFPMLPEELSEGLTSLVPGQDRLAVVTELIIGPNGEPKKSDVYRAVIRNHAKLSYAAIGAWLEGKGPVPSVIKRRAKLKAQVRLQFEAAKRLAFLRRQSGAVELGMIQTTPLVNKRGQITELAVIEPNAARELISNFMIATNVAIAQFLEAKGGPTLRRVVRSPEQWDRIVRIAAGLDGKLPAKPDSRALADFLERRKKLDPLHFPDLSLAVVKALGPGEYAVQMPHEEDQGHFGLAVADYTHSTAPNRRYADLVNQRLIKAALKDGSRPYRANDLKRIAEHCTEREDAARKVERKLRKVAAAVLLRDRIGEEFNAIVTGVVEKGTFARTIEPPVDGRIVTRARGLGVGDKVVVRLVGVDAERGFIDFVRTGRGW